MKYTEVVIIRSADTERVHEIIDMIDAIFKTDGEAEGLHIKLYSRCDLDGDLIIQLVRTSENQTPGKSRLGYALADLLSDFGYVSHTVWMERGDWWKPL